MRNAGQTTLASAIVQEFRQDTLPVGQGMARVEGRGPPLRNHRSWTACLPVSVVEALAEKP